jgi:rubrerythrin
MKNKVNYFDAEGVQKMSGSSESKTNFDQVWQRVTAANEQQETSAQPKSIQQLFEEFMEDEAFDARYYDALAGRVGTWGRNILRSIAADERTHLKKLRTAYFILTGKAYEPQTVPVKITGTADALRKRYISENEGVQAYLKAAANTQRGDMTELFRNLAADEKRHAQLINKLLENLMG